MRSPVTTLGSAPDRSVLSKNVANKKKRERDWRAGRRNHCNRNTKGKIGLVWVPAKDMGGEYLPCLSLLLSVRSVQRGRA